MPKFTFAALPSILLLCFSGCAGLQPAAPLAVALESESLTVVRGGVEVIDLDFVPAPNPFIAGLAQVSISPGAHSRQVQLRAKDTGLTTITFLRENGTVGKKLTLDVITPQQEYVLGNIRQLLGGIQGITIKPVGVVVAVDGKLVNADTVIKDFDRILQVQEAYKDYVLNLVTIGDEVYQSAARKMEAEIRALPDSQAVSVRVENGTYMLYGSVIGPESRERAETIVQTYLPPMQGSASIRENVLVLGAKKFSIRNLIQVESSGRAPASTR